MIRKGALLPEWTGSSVHILPCVKITLCILLSSFNFLHPILILSTLRLSHPAPICTNSTANPPARSRFSKRPSANMHIEGKTFVVTGGSSGLGEATIRAIVQRGGKVIIFDINEERGEAIAAELAGSAFWPGPTDVAGEDSVVESIAKGVKKFGKISGVVNCGGIGMAQKIVFRNGEPQPLNIFEEVVRINLVGTFNVCRLIAAHIIANIKDASEKEEDPGVIINVASIAYTEGQAGQTAYSASKGGVAGMTLPMARDLAGQVRVCTIAPGFFGTPMGKAVKDSNLEKHLIHPHRMGKPSEFAHLACAIIENPMMNGEIVRIDGAVRLGKL